MSKNTKKAQAKAASSNDVKVIYKDGAEERKPMALVDKKINSVMFDTKVSISTFYSKEHDKTYCFITLGQNQDKKFAIYARKDGKGVCTMTDWEDYQYTTSPKFKDAVVV